MGIMKNQYIAENCLKGAWSGLGKKEEGGVSEGGEGGLDTPMHTMLVLYVTVLIGSYGVTCDLTMMMPSTDGVIIVRSRAITDHDFKLV